MARTEGNEIDANVLEQYIVTVAQKAGLHGHDYVIQTPDGEQVIEAHVKHQIKFGRLGPPLYVTTILRDRNPLQVPGETTQETFPFTRISWQNEKTRPILTRITGVATRPLNSQKQPGEEVEWNNERFFARVQERMAGIGIPTMEELVEHTRLLERARRRDRIIYSSTDTRLIGKTIGEKWQGRFAALKTRLTTKK